MVPALQGRVFHNIESAANKLQDFVFVEDVAYAHLLLEKKLQLGGKYAGEVEK